MRHFDLDGPFAAPDEGRVSKMHLAGLIAASPVKKSAHVHWDLPVAANDACSSRSPGPDAESYLHLAGPVDNMQIDRGNLVGRPVALYPTLHPEHFPHDGASDFA